MSPGSARRAAGQASPRDLHWPRLSRLVMDFLQSPLAHASSATASGKALPASPVDHTPLGITVVDVLSPVIMGGLFVSLAVG